MNANESLETVAQCPSVWDVHRCDGTEGHEGSHWAAYPAPPASEFVELSVSRVEWEGESVQTVTAGASIPTPMISTTDGGEGAP